MSQLWFQEKRLKDDWKKCWMEIFQKNLSVPERKDGRFTYLPAEMIASVKSSRSDEIILNWRCFFGGTVPSVPSWPLTAEETVIQGEDQGCKPRSVSPFIHRCRNMRVMGFPGRRETELLALWAGLEAFGAGLESRQWRLLLPLAGEARGAAEGGMLWLLFGEEICLCVHWSSAILVGG